MNVYFYNNTKRLNSTKNAPTYDVVMDCVYKDNTSIINPIIRVKTNTKPDYNYFSIDNRYYWVNDIISVSADVWEIIGSIDVLTTYRGRILNTSAFVLYDSTPNTQLPDTRLAIETDVETHTATANMPWGFTTDSSAGTYLIATTGDPNFVDFDVGTVSYNSRAGTGVYIINHSDIEQLGFDIYDFFLALADMRDDFRHDVANWVGPNGYLSPTGTLPQDVMEALIKAAYGTANALIDTMVEYPTRLALLIAQNILGGGSALQNIKASYWLPFNIPDNAYTSAGSVLALGTYTDTLSNSLYKITKPVITAVDIPVSIPWQFDDWRDVSCTEIMLYIPLIGCVAIPPEVVKGNDTLYLRFSLNIYSGDLACEVRCDGGQIATYGASSAMNILIGDSNINMGSAVNTVIAGVTKNYGAMAGGIADTLSGMNTSVGGIGGGAGTGLTSQIVCVVRTHNTSQEPSALLSTIGTPTHQLKTLSTGLGYVQCYNAQVNNSAVSGEPYPSAREISEINGYLNTGVYLE